MHTILIVAPLLAGIIILLYTILANLLRVWLDHRVKMVLLERLQRDPRGAASAEDLQALLGEADGEGRPDRKVDYTMLGAALTGMGLCSSAAGYFWWQGQVSAGIYFGGVTCVTVGTILVLLGLLIRYLTRLPIEGAGDQGGGHGESNDERH